MSQRDRIRMTQEEVQTFLAESDKLQLATINGDGTPHLVTMYYDLFDGRIGFWTYGSSRKAVNLRRDPRLTCLVEAGDGYDQLRGVMVTGTATVLEGHDEVLEIGRRVYGRMVGDLDGLEPFLEQQATKRIGVVVEPTSTATWDHRKLAG